jgi:hypothetical protein
MIVTVRRWTSLALPRITAKSKVEKSNKSQVQEPRSHDGFLNTYHKMFEHQVNLMFKEDLPK